MDAKRRKNSLVASILTSAISLRSVNIFALMAYCYIGSVNPDSASFGVATIATIAMAVFFATSVLIVYIDREVVFRAISESWRVRILALLVVVATLLTGTTIFIVPLLFALTSIGKELKVLLKYYLLWSTVFFLGIIAMQFLGIIQSGDVAQETSDGIEVAAQSLGFGNPNGAFTYLFSILIAGYIVLNKSSKKLLFTAAALLSTIVIYSFTLSRTGLACCLLIILLAHAGKILPWRRIKKILPALFIILAVLSVVLAIYFGFRGNAINDTLSNRPYWWNIRVEDGALFNILGNADSFETGYAWWLDSAPLDSFFLRIWFRNGLLILVLYFVFFRLWTKSLRNPLLVYGTLIALFYGFSEYGIMVNYGRNILLLMMMLPIFSKYMNQGKLDFFEVKKHGR